MPEADVNTPLQEGVSLRRRADQIKKAGFSVEIIKNVFVRDVSSSKLRQKFNLTPTIEVTS